MPSRGEGAVHLARNHVHRVGDGGTYPRVRFFARLRGQAQWYGSRLVVRDETLPGYPADPTAPGPGVSTVTRGRTRTVRTVTVR